MVLIWWWGFNPEALVNAELYFITIIPGQLRTRVVALGSFIGKKQLLNHLTVFKHMGSGLFKIINNLCVHKLCMFDIYMYKYDLAWDNLVMSSWCNG